MLDKKWVSALVLAGVWYLPPPAIAAHPMPDAAWLQLQFATSGDECHRWLREWRGEHPGGVAHGYEAGCFKNGKERDPAGKPPIAEYVFQIVSQREEVRPRADAPAALIYRSLGAAQRASEESGTNPSPAGQGAVKYYEMLVFSKPVEGQDAAYNDWYDHRHVPEVIRNAGFISGQRFKRIDAAAGDAPKLPPYLVLFTLNSRDLHTTEAEIGARLKDGRTYMSPTFSGEGGGGLFITPLD